MANKRFFGLHFDFHATPEKCKDVKLGQFLEEKDVEEICHIFRPDFLQIDCKGHPGYTSYKTKVGTAATDFAKDTLKIWRDGTKKNNVDLYMHYSGIWDACYVQSHPEHIVKKPIYSDNENVEKLFLSIFGPYPEERMLAQLKEVSDYGADGVWVDGDCWACMVDVSDYALKAFSEATGIEVTKEDIVPENEIFEKYRDFLRQGFRNYVDNYAKEMHKYNKNFKVASNWAYSEQMPEEVTTAVDFLSGDFSPENAYYGAIFSGNILAAQGKPWDLMSWGFKRFVNDKTTTWCQKHPTQLMQEAAVVMALGGGYQVYLYQNADASPCMPRIRGLGPLADFCHKRKEFCFETETLPDVVLFNSTYDHYKNVPEASLFGNHWLYTSHRGWANLLADSGHSFEIREEHNLLPDIDRYKVIVCPEIIGDYEQSTKDKLLAYAQNGGVLVLAGTNALSKFGIAHEKFAAKSDKTLYNNAILASEDNRFDDILCDYAHITADGEVVAEARKGYGLGLFDEICDFAKCISYGSGKIIAIGADLGAWYGSLKTVACRQLCEKLFDYYTPNARVENSRKVMLNTTVKNGKMQIHLVNSNGDHRDDGVDSFDTITPLANLDLTVNVEKEPKAVTLQPSGEKLDFTFNNGVLKIKVPNVEIYEIAEIEF